MAFVPNTADPIPIVLHHTPSDTASPSLLYPGEAAVCHGPTHTKMWIGDGTTNRLFLSTNPADSPLLNQSVLGGPFLPLTGGTLTGPGNLTLDGGTLTVSGAAPTVTWNVAGAQPLRWSLSTVDTVYARYWGMLDVSENSGWLFVAGRSLDPPFIYSARTDYPFEMNAGFSVTGNGSLTGSLDIRGGSWIHEGLNVGGNWAWEKPSLIFTAPDEVTAANHILGDISVEAVAAIDNTPDVGYGITPWNNIWGAGIRFLSTQGWQRDTVVDPGNPPTVPPTITSRVDQLGSEIAFFVSENGGPGTYRAMTLEQDGNLSLPHAVPTAASDVVTLGYLTGAGTGFLPLSGGTLVGPGNLTLDGKLTSTGVVGTTAIDFPRGTTTWSFYADQDWFGMVSSASTPPGRGIWVHAEGRLEFETYIRFSSLTGISIDDALSVGTSGVGGGIHIAEGDLSLSHGGIIVGDGSLSVSGAGTFGWVCDALQFHATGGQFDNIWRNDTSGPTFQFRRSRGTMTAPEAPQDDDTLGNIGWAGDWDDAYNFPRRHFGVRIEAFATEDWQEHFGPTFDPTDNPSDRWTTGGAELRFSITPNGESQLRRAMTLEQDGALRLSSAQPTVVWDKTDGNLWQWQLRTGDGTGDRADHTYWSLYDDDWRFLVTRKPGPPLAYDFYMGGDTRIAGNLSVDQSISATYVSCTYIYSLGGRIESSMATDTPTDGPVISFMRSRPTGNAQTGDTLGTLLFISRDIGGGTSQTAAVRAVATEPHNINMVGSELQFFTAPNGAALRNAMTLEENANLTVVGTVTASGTLLTSDPALKEISATPADALAKVCELPVINFRWKHRQDGKMHRGFSADDVARVMGEDSGCSGKGAYSLADMNAVLWQATQELAAEVQELRRRMDGPKPRRPH